MLIGLAFTKGMSASEAVGIPSQTHEKMTCHDGDR